MKLKQHVNVWRFNLIVLFLSPLAFLFQSSAYALISNGLEKTKSGKAEKALALKNWGLDNSYASHINIRKAWEITRGSKEIILAVIDTGIDPDHPDIVDNLWKKPGTFKSKTVKGKKLETFEYGWDFVKNEANPRDTHGHGTHVAGIIGATAKANAGAAGVAPHVSIMAIRYYSPHVSGAENLANTVKAIHYAIDNGAHVINYSGGGAEFSAAEKKAIERAKDKGILFVAAAGNEHRDTDKEMNKYYPGAYGLSNIISVAATDINNQLLPSSNWGLATVHVAAPGENIFSTAPNGRYGYLTGTSQGTAFVSGLAALLMAKDSSLRANPERVREIIVNSVDPVENLKKKVISGGRINALAALNTLNAKPEAVQLAEHKEAAKGMDIIEAELDPLMIGPSFSESRKLRLPARKQNSIDSN